MCYVKGPDRGWTVTGKTLKVITGWVAFAKVSISGVAHILEHAISGPSRSRQVHWIHPLGAHRAQITRRYDFPGATAPGNHALPVFTTYGDCVISPKV